MMREITMSLTESCKIISIISYFFHSLLLFENRYQKTMGTRGERRGKTYQPLKTQKLDDSCLLRFRLTINEFDVKVVGTKNKKTFF